MIGSQGVRLPFFVFYPIIIAYFTRDFFIFSNIFSIFSANLIN